MTATAREKARSILTGLYPIVDVGPGMNERGTILFVRAFAIPGVKLVQLRCKGISDRAFYEVASGVAATARGLGLALVINDRPDIAAAVQADGVHLGADDLPLAAARRVLAPGSIIGRSTDTPEEARLAADAGADYVAWGAVFPTATKPDAAPQEGPAALARVRGALPSDVPLVAIGGITQERLPEVAAAGADAFAVIGELRDAPDPESTARKLVLAWKAARSAAR